jgi:hypothetical protein
VNDWIANIALGAPAPAPCPIDDFSTVTIDGGAATCNTPPPND